MENFSACTKRFPGFQKLAQYPGTGEVAGIAIAERKMAEASSEKVHGSHFCPVPHCGISFSFRSGLSRHIKGKHPHEEAEYRTCHVCDKR